MKKLFISAILLSSFLGVKAQSKNKLLEESFWKTKPTIVQVKQAIAEGNNPSELNAMAFDPVSMALFSNTPSDVITFLLNQKGNDVNKLTHDHRTYIFWAAMSGDVTTMQYLINKGAKVNLEDSHGLTPLAFCAMFGVGKVDVYKLLVDAGADLKRKYENGSSLLLVSIANDSTDLSLTNYLVSKGFSLKDKDNNGNNAFDYATIGGNIALLKTLYSKGLRPTKNAMLLASEGRWWSANKLELFQYLSSIGVHPDVIGAKHDNALHYVLQKRNQEDVVRWLLQNNVDANLIDVNGNSPLLYASSNSDSKLLELVLPKVKDVNYVNKEGVSPILIAVQRGNATMVKLLLDKNATITAKDNKGNGIPYYLIQSYRGAGRGGYEGEGVKIDPVKDFDEKIVLLKKAGVDFNTVQDNDNSLYHLAIAKNDTNLLSRIDQFHIDINAKNKDGLTALQKAAMVSKDAKVLQYLVSMGADKSLKTEMGETAYDLAKENDYFKKNNISFEFLK